MPPSTPPGTAPLAPLHFLVTVAGISDDGNDPRGGFREVSGLGLSIDVIEYRSGSDTSAVRKVPGLVRYPNVTLRRGLIADLRFFEWIRAAAEGRVVKANVTITLLDGGRRPAVRWTLRNAWPCRWEGPRLDAEGMDVAIESIELTHEGLGVEVGVEVGA